MSVVLHLNAGVTLLLAVTTLLGAATSDKRTLLLLDAWRRVPDLFELARASTKDGDVHREQDRLEKDHHAKRLPFRTTSNFRHQMRCSTQEHTFGAALFRLVNAEGESVTITPKLCTKSNSMVRPSLRRSPPSCSNSPRPRPSRPTPSPW